MFTILVVDDSKVDRKLSGRLLERHKEYNVVYATNGKDALQQLELHVPDLVVTDIQMPEMDGLELVEAIKIEYPLIPVVLMTAKGSEVTAVHALERGAASYVPKRMLAYQLEETVEQVLQNARQERSHSRLLARMLENEICFELENDLPLIPSTVHYIQQVLFGLRFCSESERLRVGVALEEALLNAYYHGNLEVDSALREIDHASYYELAKERSCQAPYMQRRIVVKAHFTQERSTFIIRDEGPGFDPNVLPDATDPANLERPCGRGLLLMRTFMDEVSFNDTGNEVCMVKLRQDPPTVEEDEVDVIQ